MLNRGALQFSAAQVNASTNQPARWLGALQIVCIRSKTVFMRVVKLVPTLALLQ